MLRLAAAAFLVVCIHLSGMGSSGDTSGHSMGPEPVWGANGHPINQEAYWGNMELQMEVMRNIGLHYYRVDMPYAGDGVLDSLSAARLDRLHALAVSSDITIVPVVFLPEARILYGMDSVTAYRSGFVAGSGFAHRYKGYFSYYEMGNEYDGDVMKLPAGDGSDTAHYDRSRIRILGSALKGMSDGIRREDAKAGIIVSNAGWMHYAYFRLLEDEGVQFDIIGYHWYEDAKYLKTALDALNFYFPGRPVWFTEVNARNKGTGYSPRYQKNHVKKYIKVIRRRGKNIMGFFIYELFDQPAHGEPRERSYGLVSWEERYKKFSYKPLAIFIRDRLARIAHTH
ncbi:MAG TPA: glycosyl hydrolase [Puia sp.]|jgi:hypothetical protein|nr:glycosyl hydrolase [Puia sp.]